MVNVWDVVADAGTGETTYTSTVVWSGNPSAANTNNVTGLGMIDGSFQGFNANFNFTILTPPTAADDSIAMLLTDAPIIFDVRDNDTDFEGTLINDITINSDVTLSAAGSAAVVTGGAGGSIIGDDVNIDQTITYTPGSVGVDTLKYTVVDGRGVASEIGTVTVTVTAAPTTSDVEFNVRPGVAVTTDINITDLDFLGLDIATDLDGDALTFVITDGAIASGASIAGNGTNTLTYTPKDDTLYSGDTFTFQVFDGTNTSVGTSTMTINTVNTVPVANDDNVSMLDNAANLVISPIVNDSDAEDGAPPTGAIITAALFPTITTTEGGAVTDNGGGTLLYTPPVGFTPGDFTVDTFVYTIDDQDSGTSNDATVTVNLLPNAGGANNAPVSYDSDFATVGGVAKIINIGANADSTGKGGAGAAGVIADDVDVEALTFASFSATSVQGGTITSDGSNLTYTPPASFSGGATDTFNFQVTDGKDDSNVSVITMTVDLAPPTAVADVGEMLITDTDINVAVRANDTDFEDGAAIQTAGIVALGADGIDGTDTAGGTITLETDNTITYTPANVGTGTFSYTIEDSDGLISSPEATVTVTVTALPVTADTPLTTAEDVAITTITAASVATDLDGDTLTFETYSDGTHATGAGVVTINGANDTLTYTPKADFNGEDTFTFSVTDGVNVSTGTSTITVTITAAPDLMDCNNINIATATDTAKIISSAELVGHCSDADNLVDGTVSLEGTITQPNEALAGSSLVNNLDGTLTYTPGTDVTLDTFSYTVTDGAGETKIITATVTVDNTAAKAIHIISGSNFTMLGSDGSLAGGATDVTGVFDENKICSAVTCTDFAIAPALASAQTFSGELWTAHHIRIFGPGTYTFDTACSGTDITAGTTNCGGIAPLTLTVADGQLGGHMLFDWGTNSDIDVAILWDYNTSFGDPIHSTGAPTHTATKQWNWTSVDGDGTAGGVVTGTTTPIRGLKMVDGPFKGFNANFNLDMTSGYTPPVANDDSTSTTPSLLTVIDLLANDNDAEDGAPPVGAVVTLDTTATAAGSVLVDNLDGTVDYTPDATLVDGDTDTFTYTIADTGGALSNVATVTITITATINTAPVANDVAFDSDEDTTLDIDITSVDTASVVVASDDELDTLTFKTFDAATTQGGTVTVDATNSILTYTPLGDFNGTDTFTFSVNDGLADSNVATVTLTVNPVNDAVVCTDVVLATPVDTALTIVAATDLITGCSDVDGDTISYASAAAPANVASTITDDSAGTLTYTPEAGLIGSDSFVFTATDGNGGDGTATANIQVGTVYGNFTMLDASGNVFGGTNDVVFTWDGISMHSSEADLSSNMTIVSNGPHPFFGAPWFAHHVRVFGPGTYSFEADNALCESKATSPDAANAGTRTLNSGADDIDVTGCPGTGTATTITMTVATGQIGVHILFDYNGSFDIDVVNVYDMNAAWEDATGQGDKLNDLWTGASGAAPDPTSDWALVSRDVNGDAINGAPMVDGPFLGFYANFNDSPGGTAAATPDITTEASDTKLGGGAFGLILLLGTLPLIVLFRRRNT